MSKPVIISLIITGALLLVGLICGLGGIGLYNTEASLKVTYESKIKANEAIFDNTWKKISQSAQVTDAQKNALKEIFNSYAEARGGAGSGGQLAKWTQEAVPNVDASVYRNLQNIITGARDEWTGNQVALVSIANEYNKNLATFPGNMLLRAFNFQPIDAKTITSTRTENTFQSGKDDDVSLPLSH